MRKSKDQNTEGGNKTTWSMTSSANSSIPAIVDAKKAVELRMTLLLHTFSNWPRASWGMHGIQSCSSVDNASRAMQQGEREPGEQTSTAAPLCVGRNRSRRHPLSAMAVYRCSVTTDPEGDPAGDPLSPTSMITESAVIDLHLAFNLAAS